MSKIGFSHNCSKYGIAATNNINCFLPIILFVYRWPCIHRSAYLCVMGRLLFLWLIAFLCSGSYVRAASYSFEFTPNCSKAYENYLSLHIHEARADIIREIKANPYNLMAVYIADYEDCILLLLNCDKADYDQRKDHLDERIALLDKGSEASPWLRLCKAGVYLHWAIVNMRFGQQYSTARLFHKSFSLLRDNRQLFPDFGYNDSFAGLEEAVVGSLPGSYKWLASIFGMKGNVRKGTGKLAAFVADHSPGQPMYSETVLYYMYTRFYLLQEQKEVWAMLSAPEFSATNNLLRTFVKANLALDCRRSDAAIETLKAAMKDPGYNSYPVFDYQMGVALLSKTDTACVYFFNQYLEKNKSDLYIKDCWQKMALAWYIAGNMPQAAYCRQQILTVGTARIDADKQARKFAEDKTWPLKDLLRARLLIDGGYYGRAQNLLGSIDTIGLTNVADKAEYYFRLGRVHEESGNYEHALACYRSAIYTGKNRHEQFAARAALQMGRVYELTGNTAMAVNSYNECLDMPGHDFQNSIDQQAKAGINRLQGK